MITKFIREESLECDRLGDLQGDVVIVSERLKKNKSLQKKINWTKLKRFVITQSGSIVISECWNFEFNYQIASPLAKLGEIECYGVDWIYYTHYMFHWLTSVNIIKNIRVTYKMSPKYTA
jgi:hypothetical protein